MQAVSRGPKLQLKSPIELAIRGLLRHPIYLGLALLVSTLASGALAYQFHKTRYHYCGKMLYIPNRVTEPYYVSPDLANLTGSIINPEMMEALREKCGVDEDLEMFRSRLRFEIAGVATIDTSYSSEDPNEARRVLEEAMRTFITAAGQVRRDAITQHIHDVDREVAAAIKIAIDGSGRLEAELAKRDLKTAESLNATIVDLRKSIFDSQTRIAAAFDQRQLSRAQFEALMAMRLKGVTDGNDASSEDAPDGDAASMSDSFADDGTKPGDDRSDSNSKEDSKPTQRDVELASFENKKNELETIYDAQKQRLVEEKLRREKDQARLDALLKTKRTEYERTKLLHDRDLVSQAELDRAKGEMDVLLAERNSQVRSMETQLDKIYGRIDDRTESMLLGAGSASLMIPGMPLSSSSQSTEKQTIALLQGSESAAEKNFDLLQEELRSKSAELEQLISLQRTISPLVRDVERSDETIDRLIAQNEVFNQTVRSDSDEIRVVQDAVPMVNGVATNATKLFGAGLIGSMLCFVAPLFLVKLKSASEQRPKTETAFGIPILGKKPTEKQRRVNGDLADEEVRRLALRICHRFTSDRGVLTVAGTDERGSNGLVNQIAQELNSEGRTTAIIDAGELIGRQAAVASEMPDGQAADGKVSFDELKARHDVVIVSAEIFGRVLQLETAASRSDAVVLVSPRSDIQTAVMQKTVADLNDLGTRILGVIEG